MPSTSSLGWAVVQINLSVVASPEPDAERQAEWRERNVEKIKQSADTD
jgi:hypothetical protein